MKLHWLSSSLPVPFCSEIRQLSLMDASGVNASSGISDLYASIAALRAEPCQFKPIQKSSSVFFKYVRHSSLRAWLAWRCGRCGADLPSQSSIMLGKHEIGVEFFNVAARFWVSDLNLMAGKLVSKSLRRGLGAQTSSRSCSVLSKCSQRL